MIHLNIEASYPECPIIHNNNLYYVEYNNDSIISYDLKTHNKTIIKLPENTGPCGLLFFNNELVVAFYNAHMIYFLDSKDKISIPYPNDMCISIDGIFITSSGDNKSGDPFLNSSLPSGSIYYMTNTKTVHKIDTRPIHYTNGITLYSNKLYVSEHLENRILQFNIKYTEGDHIPYLTNTTIYIDLPTVTNNLFGPDGIYMDNDKNLYIAHFGTGYIIKYDKYKNIIYKYDVGSKYVTNITIHDENMYITTVDDLKNSSGFVKSIYDSNIKK